MKKWMTAGIALLPLLTNSAVIDHIGSGFSWGADWKPIAGINDAADADAPDKLDFVGDSENWGGYWDSNANYVFFRMRLDISSTNLSSASFFVLLDVVGQGAEDNKPDFGFAWDNQSAQVSDHGLEMSVRGAVDTKWNTSKMADWDNDQKKGANDINGAGRITDGYVRSTDTQATVNFGDTTFLDFAVSWDYLNTYVTNAVGAAYLQPGQEWKIQFATIANSTDHGFLGQGGDIAGDQTPGSSITIDSWSEAQAIPEPTCLALISLFGAATLITKRIFC